MPDLDLESERSKDAKEEDWNFNNFEGAQIDNKSAKLSANKSLNNKPSSSHSNTKKFNINDLRADNEDYDDDFL